jgi:N utilization substance protein B
MKKSYEQYLVILLLLAELRDYANLRITQIQERQIKDEEAWKRLERFANNRVLAQLADNPDLQSAVTNEKLSLENYKTSVKEIYKNIIESEFYDVYIKSDDSYQADKNFVRTLLLNVVAETESLFDSFEESSIFMNDDADNVVSMVEKTVKWFSESSEYGGDILPMFGDAETHDFGFNLFVKAVNMWDEINPYIDKNLKNWIQERVAEMDIIIMQLAVTEIIAYKEIPIPVSLNEYIEIAKWYSTENSGSFINGILYKVIEDLKKEGKIQKVGRGLITK